MWWSEWWIYLNFTSTVFTETNNIVEMDGSSNSKASSLFVGDLSMFCTEVELEQVFAPYGELLEIKIMRNEETNRNLSYGFIKFATVACANAALEELNGFILCGRPLRIGWAAYKSRKNARQQQQQQGGGGGRGSSGEGLGEGMSGTTGGQQFNKQPNALETSPVHVSYISYKLDRLVTEESLREVFDQFGTVIDTSIKKSQIDQVRFICSLLLISTYHLISLFLVYVFPFSLEYPPPPFFSPRHYYDL